MEENVFAADTIPQDIQETQGDEELTLTESRENTEKQPDAYEEQKESRSAPEEGDLTIRFNHKDLTLKADEAKNYAQKGMYYEKQGLDKLYSRLSEYAEEKGLSVDELVDSIRCAGASLNDEQASRDSDDRRIAEEFLTLQKEFSDIKSYADLPQAVKQAAIDGKNLITAYLYHLHTENKAIAEAKATAERAARSSTGSVDSAETETTVDNAFIAGLWST